jgi:hypothetical protein
LIATGNSTSNRINSGYIRPSGPSFQSGRTHFIPVGRGRDMSEADLTPSQREWLMRKLVEYLQEGRIGVISTASQFGPA